MLLNENDKIIARKYWHRRLVNNCPLCNGKGYTILNNVDGYTLSKNCQCIMNVNTNVHLEDWGVPRRFLENKWSLKLLEDKSYCEIIKDYINNFQTYYDEGKGLFLTGNHGRGKSTIECIIAKQISKLYNSDTNDYYSVAFALYEDLIQWKLDKNDKQDQLEQFLYKSSLLIIDNIGNETGRNENRFSQRMLEIILRKRDNMSLPTIISSNDSLEDIQNKYGEDIHDFINLNCKEIFVSGENHRQKNAENEESVWIN